MTLRHIVTWKLNGASRAERDVQAAEISAALISLRGTVPTLRALTVHRNELVDADDAMDAAAAAASNWDITLVADFDDAEGLAAYAVHPAHLEAAAVIKRHAIGRVATDFQI